MTARKATIPRRSLLEDGLPVEELYALATREGNTKKPVYQMHKWWARRLGHVFRILLIASTMPSPGRAKKSATNRLLSRFYQRNKLKGLVVCDPFMGGGTSVVESLKCGARVIGVDIDPVAWFVTKKEIETCDQARVLKAYEQLRRTVGAEVRQLYAIRLPGRKTGEIVNAFWVARVRCGGCRRAYDAHPHYRLAYDKKTSRQDVFCRECGEIANISFSRKSFTCEQCSTRTRIEEGPTTRGVSTCPSCAFETRLDLHSKPGQPLRKRLFAVEYTVDGDTSGYRGRPKRHFRRATSLDLAAYAKAADALRTKRRTLSFPRAKIFKRGRFDARPLSHGYARYAQLFNARQLYCLARIYGEILALEDSQAREYLLLAFSDSLAANNQLVSYAFGYRKATPLFGLHCFNIVQRPVEGNVWGHPVYGRGSFERCVRKVIDGKRYSATPFEYRYDANGEPSRVTTGEIVDTGVATGFSNWKPGQGALLLHQSSASLRAIPSNFVNLVLTDPPFYDNLPYSELSDFYYQWLRPYLKRFGVASNSTAPARESFFVRRSTVAEHSRYLEGLTKSFGECSRILKRTGMLAFTFQHTSPRAWHALGVALQRADFIVSGLSPVRAEGVSGFHSYAGTPKWDAVICCRPAPANSSIRQTTFDSARALAVVERIESKWTKRFKKNRIPWSHADRASFSYAVALQEAVNQRLEPFEYAEVLSAIGRSYPLPTPTQILSDEHVTASLQTG
jgi:putative DNA methylase